MMQNLLFEGRPINMCTDEQLQRAYNIATNPGSINDHQYWVIESTYPMACYIKKIKDRRSDEGVKVRPIVVV